MDFNSKKEVTKRVKEMKKETQSLNDLRAIARTVFQTWIRLRDEKQPCISCGKTEAKWDAGHFMKCEIYTSLIFNEDNCHKQCSHCNCQLQGNVLEYRNRLILRIGEERLLALEAKADISRVYKFGLQELIDIAAEYRNRIKQLKSKNNVGSNIYDVKIIR